MTSAVWCRAVNFLPVDVYVLRCLPRPYAFEEGLPLMQKAVDTELRPIELGGQPTGNGASAAAFAVRPWSGPNGSTPRCSEVVTEV
jgi:NADH:ubiquinone oxidoreductase subunit B-like Fe-S oxidoreductase